MRSLTTIFLVLLANLAMLVHAVVPHHHHNKLFSAVVNLLDEDSQQAFNHANLQGRHFHFASSCTGQEEESKSKVLVIQSYG